MKTKILFLLVCGLIAGCASPPSKPVAKFPPQQTPTPKAEATGQIKKWIAQLSDADYAKRNAAVAALATQPDDALPLLQVALKTEADSNHLWWISVAIQECEERRTKPGEISASPDNFKGLQTCDACNGGDGMFFLVALDGGR